MKIYDPVKGTSSDPFLITDSAEAFNDNLIEWSYQVQSQLQIAAGDFDNDTVDEIAVYVPASTGAAPRVAIYDLTNGVECATPYSKSSWQNSWNYILPKTSAQVVECEAPTGQSGSDRYYISNFYNNIDLAAADADNDGSCDLVISYGASDVDKAAETKQAIQRSLPSRSVILYGSNGDDSHGSQMLRDSQELNYGDDKLIRVSFGFGDLDGDGNEEMIMGGQLQSEQSTNYSRVLGKYDYDADSGDMVCESVQKVNIVDGQWSEIEDSDGHKKKVFASSNGWDGYYHSMPAMNTNVAVGKLFGDQSETRIYMDSVLYSFDSTFSIVDELEDPSLADPNNSESGKKGSAVFTDMEGMVQQKWTQLDYYEYGASMGNYTGSIEDYLSVQRVSQETRNPDNEVRYHADASVLVPVESDDNDEVHSLERKSNKSETMTCTEAGEVTLIPADTDMDSAVAKYTGQHEITYQDPRVLAVIASAPYFKDVADYDESENMLEDSETSYGESTGKEDEFSQNVTIESGIYTNNTIAFGAKTIWVTDLVGINVNAQLGFQFTEDWGNSTSKDFEVSYSTAAGEDQVVLFSTPTENFTYEVTTGAVDDEGNVSLMKQMQVIPNAHQPVTKVIPLEKYMEIQKRQTKDKLPDVTKYLTSKPGYPSTYPNSKNNIPQAVKDSWADVYKFQYLQYLKDKNKAGSGLVNGGVLNGNKPAKMEIDDYTWYQPGEWEGAGFGSGAITQTLTTGDSDYDRKGYGGYFSLEVGAHFKFEGGQGFVESYDGDVGAHFSVGGDEGMTYHHNKAVTCSGTVANMPESAEGYGYDFDWCLMEYMVHSSDECIFPVVTYMVKEVKSPPKLPDSISQDFDRTTDSQICLTWNYTDATPQAFEVYRYKDFPQGGGDELVGTVSGDSATILKDADGSTVTDSNGKVIKQYSFTEEGLTADSEYKYRLKVKRETWPSESIFSPVIKARTDVSEKPALSLSADTLTIYPDGQYNLSVVLADPDNYEESIDYQWQIYDTGTKSWQDMSGRDKKTVRFSNCKAIDAGQYRCRVNLVRKHESSPQYISAYTNACVVKYSKREVAFDPIAVFEGTGNSATNTGIMVGVKNASNAGTSKPSGDVTFHLEGPNGILTLSAAVDEQTGIARIDSIEDELSTLSQEAFVNGGYLVTAEYEGDYVFNPAEDEEQYHYLRQIEACDFLSVESTYIFGQDMMPTTKLYRYTEQEGGVIHREDITDQLTGLKLYAADADGHKGDKVADIDLSGADKTAKIPLNVKLKKRAYIEAYVSGSDDPVAYQIIKTAQRNATITLSGKTTGSGNLLKLYSFDDISVTGDCDMKEKNIVAADGETMKSLEDLIIFKYYEDSGDYLFDSTVAESHRSDFIPSRYKVDLAAKDKDSKTLYETFYDFNNPAKADFLVVGSDYEVTAAASDPGAGSVRMISPILLNEVDKVGFSGGSKITLKALPAEGFTIKKWVISDGQGGTQTQNGGDLLTYTLRSEPTANSDGQVGITAVFEPKNQTLTYEAKGEGTITVDPHFASGSTVLEGTSMQFTARAADGWHFKEWRWTNFGGDDSVSQGVSGSGNVNTKTYTMGDTAAAVYAVFFKDTIDIDLDDHLNASYINDGSNPLEDIGEEISVTKGKEVPKGTTVRVVTASGYEPAKDAEWIVNITTPAGTSQVEAEQIMSGSSEGCEFDLPDDVTACSVQLETQKGFYSIGLDGDNVSYVVSLDGTKVPESQYQQMLQRIEGGTFVEVQAIPKRGKLFKDWLVDGVVNKDAAQTYSFTMKDSVTLQAEVDDDEEHTIKIKATGAGTGLYTITGHNGEVISENFGTVEKTITAYKGESLTICDDPNDTGHILTTVRMNGERQDLVEGVFTLESITEDAEFICSFQPTTYCTISFQNEIDGDKQPQLLDGDGNDMDFTDTVDVGSGEEFSFSIIMDNSCPCHVRYKDGTLNPVSTDQWGDSTKYNYKFVVQETDTLTVDDRDEYTISNWTEFDQFMKDVNSLNGGGGRPTAVITADIEMPDDATLTTCSGAFRGTLDGQGHKISGLRLEGENGAPAQCESSLFGSIAKGGAVKNLTIEGYDAYVQERIADDGETTYGNALITRKNHGTISGVTIKDCSLRQHTMLDYDPNNPFAPELAGVAAYNTGTIEACTVISLKLKATERYEMSGNQIGCGVALKNHIGSDKGEITGCYVEGLKIWSGDDDDKKNYIDATETIIADDSAGDGAGLFTGNYFRVYGSGPNGDSSRGNNVTTITNDPDDVTFAGNLAYHINHETEKDLWGIRKPSATAGSGVVTPEIIPLAYGGENCKAPVKAEFKYKETDYALYLYPDKWKLPGREKFGNDEELAFWKIGEEGTVAYSIEYDSLEITKDTLFIGVSSLDGGVAQLYGVDADGNKTGIICYSDLKEAFAAAKATELENPHLDIVGDCTMDSGSFTVRSGMVMTVCSGAALTMNRSASIANKGTFTCAEGGKLHKYGSMTNSGTINVEAQDVFYNYGSKLSNSGANAVINNRDKIHCDPHVMSEWQCADHPNEDGSWTSTASCEVCCKEYEEKTDPDPEADEITSIDVFRYPTTAEYKTGDAFDDSGLMIAATLKSGLMAKVTNYTMTISYGVSDPAPITDGDILSKHGAMEITVSYKGFACTFPIIVRSAVTGIAIADGDREVAKGETLQLGAVVTPDGVQADIHWTSEDESVATVNNNGLVTGVSGGQAKITATVDDMSASCTVTVHEAATSLELDEYSILVPVDGYDLIAARVAPATADVDVTWTVSDPSVAGICVTDEGTGEMTIADTVTTKLSKGSASEASSYIAVAGRSEGQTVIKVSVKDDRGLTIHKDCTVNVQDAGGAWVRILKDGAPVSGKTLTVDSSEKTIALRAESSLDDDTLDWSSVDDIEDPVIDVSDAGKVTLKRSGMAVVKVTSDTTGLSDVCVLNVVSMPVSIKLSASDIHMASGVVKMLSASVSPEKVDGTVEWISSDRNVATVSDSGAITGIGEGKTIITAQSTADPDVKAECTVTVYDPNIKIELSSDTFYYDGTVKMPSATVVSGNQILASNITQSNSRILLMYEGAVSGPGEVKVTAIGRDDGMGVATTAYNIKVQPTTIKKVKRQKKALKVTWVKGKKGLIAGYQVQAATDPDFTMNKKTKTIKKIKTKTAKIKKLKKKTLYYVRVRTYLKVGGTTYYSDWSPVVQKKTK